MDWNKIKTIHLIGAKGTGMIMLAQFLAAQQKILSGSDIRDRFATDIVLKKINLKLYEEFSPANIPADCDLIIYSTAYTPEKNPELAAALASKIKTMTYAQALGDIFQEHYGIAIAGSHGKTTTSAWLGFVMRAANFDPSVMVGGNVPQFNGGSLVGASNYMVIEADEYQNKLQYYSPKMILLNNIDYDHPDFFPTPDDYQQTFVDFIAKLPKSGKLIANFDDEIVAQISQNCPGKVISYGIDNAKVDYRAYDLKFADNQQFFKVKTAANDELGEFIIQLAGKHNVANALAVIAASLELEIELYDLRKALAEFSGTMRRLELLGEFRGAKLIDDFAHHPTEIRAALAAVRQLYPKHKLLCVFQPHTTSRTRALFNDFVESFNEVDDLIVLDVFSSAREEAESQSSQDLVEKIKLYFESSLDEDQQKKRILYLSTASEAENYLRAKAVNGDIVLFLGAGDGWQIAQNLLK